MTCSFCTVGSVEKNSTRLPSVTTSSLRASATASCVGTTNAAVSPRMRFGRAFTMANPPSRMSAIVIGRSVIVGAPSPSAACRPRPPGRPTTAGTGRVTAVGAAERAGLGLGRPPRRARPMPPAAGSVVLHGAIIAQDEGCRRSGGRRGRLRTQHLRRPLRRRLRRLVRRRLRRRTRPSARVDGAGRPAADACSSSAPAAAGWPCPWPRRGSTCGRSTPRRPCSTGCAPGPAATAVHAVVDDMAELADPALGAAAPFAVVLCAFNTLFNLTDTDAQRRCLGRVPGAAGPAAACWSSRRSCPPPGRRGRRGRRRRRAPPHRPRRGRPHREPARPGDPHDHGPARADHRVGRAPAAVGAALRLARPARRPRGRGRAARWSSATVGGEGEPFTAAVRPHVSVYAPAG